MPSPQPYGVVFLTCLVVNIATLCGVAFVACNVLPAETTAGFQAALLALSAGALIGCAVFLILVEASHMIGAEWRNEAEATWRWGAMVMAGFLTPMACFLLEPSKLLEALAPAPAVSTEKPKEGDLVSVDVAATSNHKATTIFAVCIGDFFHNLVDGFAIAVGFKYCSGSLAWGIFAATLYHEIAQEVADYVVLTSSAVGLKPLQALGINFLAGTSVIIGGMIAVGVDVGNGPLGLLLAFGGGTYLYLGCSETVPKALALGNGLDIPALKKHYAIILASFLFGAIVVGLILLDHEHCSVPTDDDGGSDDPHAGHNHRRLLGF